MLEQVELADALKAEILELEAKLETTDHFALLGLPPGTDAATAKAAYFKLSRRFHPDRYFRKNLGSFKLRIERIFKALSKAHQALTDPQKREAYLDAHPWLKPVQLPARKPMQRMTWQKKDIPLPPVNLAPKREK